MASTDLTPREEVELDNLARGLVAPLDRLITAMLKHWPVPEQMPADLAAPFDAVLDAHADILEHPAFARLWREYVETAGGNGPR